MKAEHIPLKNRIYGDLIQESTGNVEILAQDQSLVRTCLDLIKFMHNLVQDPHAKGACWKVEATIALRLW